MLSFLVLCVFLILATEQLFSGTTTREILLTGRLRRSEQPVQPNLPEAFVSDNVLTLVFDETLEEEFIIVSVSDKSGNIVSEMMVWADGIDEISMMVDINDGEDYILNVNSVEMDLEGEF
jgi:hypothetical protein